MSNVSLRSKTEIHKYKGNSPRAAGFDLMETIEDSNANKGKIIASQILVSAWYDIIPDSTIAAAILEKIVHTAIRMDLKGDSLRKNK